MTRSAFALASCLLISCMQSHGKQIELRGDDCYTCHTQDFDLTSAPVHSTAGFPTTCVDCHRNTSWQPALGGLHPEPRFATQSGSHVDIKCLGCHDLDLGLPSVAGADTDCVQCHPDTAYQRESHVGVKGPLGQAYAYTAAVPNFCLTCHPAGTANKHPNDRFPRSGPHDRPCITCHDRSAGPDTQGMNTTCLNSGCHSLGDEDGEHRGEDGYSEARGDGSNRHFCLLCHPTGRE